MSESADYLRSIGVLDMDTHAKIAIGRTETASPPRAFMSGPEIKGLRTAAHMSQADFARHLNVTPRYISQLERELQRPTGPALVLLDIIRRKGIGALL